MPGQSSNCGTLRSVSAARGSTMIAHSLRCRSWAHRFWSTTSDRWLMAGLSSPVTRMNPLGSTRTHCRPHRRQGSGRGSSFVMISIIPRDVPFGKPKGYSLIMSHTPISVMAVEVCRPANRSLRRCRCSKPGRRFCTTRSSSAVTRPSVRTPTVLLRPTSMRRSTSVLPHSPATMTAWDQTFEEIDL